MIYYSFKVTPFVLDYGINTTSTVENLENIGKCKEANKNSLNFHNLYKRILPYKHTFFQSFIHA